MFGEDFAFLNLGTPELLIILLIVLLLFGGRKLPELARSAGSSISELRKGLNDGKTTTSKNQKQADEKSHQSAS